MNVGKGTCLNKFKVKTQSPPPLWSQISWSWVSVVFKDLGIILSNSTIFLYSQYVKISHKWWAYIPKPPCQFCQISWHVITDQYSCVTKAKKNMLSVWTQFNQQAGTMAIWSHNTLLQATAFTHMPLLWFCHNKMLNLKHYCMYTYIHTYTHTS